MRFNIHELEMKERFLDEESHSSDPKHKAAKMLMDKGLAKNMKQAYAMCDKYMDSKTGKLDQKKIKRDIENMK